MAKQRVSQSIQSASQVVGDFKHENRPTTGQPSTFSREPIMRLASHIKGKNAVVYLWPDHIEWELERMGGMNKAAAVATFGASMLVTGRTGKKTNETLLLKHVTNVSSHKDGLIYYAVEVAFSAGINQSTVSFRVTRDQADVFRDAILQAITNLDNKDTSVTINTTPTPQPAPVSAVDPMEQLAKLKNLFDAGVLTPEEFNAKKSQILAQM
ncbi:MAG: SHOCT domain-containing protein [Propionibacteriaceae bacterium]|nr:SHOCT domain-containing protein [Propionibacteriaceae bacterium]